MKTISDFIGEEVMRTVGDPVTAESPALAKLRPLLEAKRNEYFSALAMPATYDRKGKPDKTREAKIKALRKELDGLEAQFNALADAEATSLEDQARRAQAQYDIVAAKSKAATITASTASLLNSTTGSDANPAYAPGVAPLDFNAPAPKPAVNWTLYAGGALALGLIAFVALRKRKGRK